MSQAEYHRFDERDAAFRSDASPNTAEPLEQVGRSILDLLQRASENAEDNRQRALQQAEKIAQQLRAAELRMSDLESEAVYHQDRANRAENWLRQISTEIERRFFRSGDNRRHDSPPSVRSILQGARRV